MPPRSFLFKKALCFATIIASTAIAQARIKMNAMCYLESKPGSEVMAFNTTTQEAARTALLKKYPTNVTTEDVKTKFRIASLSKVLTTHWAIATLGPEYRFKTKIYVTPGAGEKVCNVHFEGDGDPYMGREMLGYVFPQLRQTLKDKKCTAIDTLSYDENFYVYLDALKHHRNEGFGRYNPAPLVGKVRTSTDFKAYLKYKSGLRYNEKNVGPISKERYQAYVSQVPYTVYSFKSRPLHMMLRDFNKFSYNYAPEVLFLRLGGVDAYQKFIASRLQLDSNSVEMYNGSGYPVMLKDGDEENKVYNLVSCAALVKITQDLDLLLSVSKTAYSASRAYQLVDVMPTGGDGETYSTFQGLYKTGGYGNTLVAKTGTADLAITFGGMLNTKDGHLYFAALTSPTNASADAARSYIRDLVQTMVNRTSLSRFAYTQIGNMVGFDREATLVQEKVVAEAPAPKTETAPVAIPLKLK